MKKIHIIINPVSGTCSKKDIPRLLEKKLPDHLFEKKILFTEYKGHACSLTQQIVSEGTDYIIAVGGDGTVNEIAKAMVHSDAVLGIIPSGSGNGLARDLQIPINPYKAIDVIAKENVITIDYCMANQHIFFCTCGFGFDALVSEKFAQEKTRGYLSYLKNVISEYIKFHPDDYEIISDHVVIKEKAFLVTCANASQYGNNAFIAPHAHINDGKMDIVVISPINPFEAAPLAFQLFTKKIDKNSKTLSFQSSSVWIKRKTPGIMHIDGDPIQVDKEVSIKVIPSGLRVIVPLDSDKRSPVQSQINDIQSFFRELIRRILE